jgi:hypothetical protein
MLLRKTLVAVIGVSMLGLVGCGGSGDEDQALEMAATACTQALADAQTGEGDADVVDARSQAADTAADAANLDPRWDPLVEAATGWEQTTRDLMDATQNLDSLNEITLAQLGDDLSESQRQLQTQCRKVRAAGGSVDTLDDLSN